MKTYGSTIFAMFRVIFGLYLTIHFLQIHPVASELFSNKGVIKDTSLLPAYNKIPLFLLSYDDEFIIQSFLKLLICSSIMFTLGYYRRLNALFLFYGWISLLNRNPLISNPSLGYIGWMMLACAIIPKGERIGFLLSEKQRQEEKIKWEMPDVIYYGMWIIIGISYTASGLHKLQCPDWINGTALNYILDGPMARQNFIVKFLLLNPLLIKVMTWASLFLEISCMFLGTFNKTRKYYWFMFMGFHLGILATINFADLTYGMLIVHLFTFDASWFKITEDFIVKYDLKKKPLFAYGIKRIDRSNYIDQSSSHNTIFNIKNVMWCASFVLLIGLVIGGLYRNQLTELTIDMYRGFGFLVIVLAILMILERLFPDQKINKVDGWWKWVTLD